VLHLPAIHHKALAIIFIKQSQLLAPEMLALHETTVTFIFFMKEIVHLFTP
jgi:hypothetical protein